MTIGAQVHRQQECFPLFFLASASKMTSVADNYNAGESGQYHWVLGSILQCLLLKLSMLRAFLLLSQVLILPLQQTVFSGLLALLSSLHMRILHCCLRFFNTGVMHFNWSAIWVSKAPSKICFFMWLLVRGGVLTHNNFQRKSFHLASSCVNCYSAEECIEHLFSSCTVSSQLWKIFCPTVILQRQLSPSLLNNLANLGNVSLTCRGTLCWKLLPHALCWATWLERNNQIFEEVSVSMEILVIEVKELLWLWVQEEGCMKNTRFETLVFDWDSLFL